MIKISFIILFIFVFLVQNEKQIVFAEGIKKDVLVLINNSDFLQLEGELLQFKSDVEIKLGVKIKILSTEGFDKYKPEEIRNILIDQCELDTVLGCKKIEGAIFVGDIPYALYDMVYDTAFDFPAPFMFYYQDLDSTFLKNEKGQYYGYKLFGSHEGPEIYVSWIRSLENLDYGSNIEQLRRYFDKHHRFFSGETVPSKVFFWAVHCNQPSNRVDFYKDAYAKNYKKEDFVSLYPEEGCDNLEPLIPELKRLLSNSPEVAFLHSHGDPKWTWGINGGNLLQLEHQPLLLYSWGCGNGNFDNDKTHAFSLSFINGNDLGLSYLGKLHSTDIKRDDTPACTTCRFVNGQEHFFRYWNEGDYVGKALLNVMQDYVSFKNEYEPDGTPLNLYRISGPLQTIIVGSPFVYSLAVRDVLPTPIVLCELKVSGDANCDKVVNIFDFAIWKVQFIRQGADKSADFDGDGKISIVDFAIWKVGFLQELKK